VDGVLRTHVWLPGGPPTFYARFGDVVGWTCVILAAIASLLTIQKSRLDGEINTDEERSNEEVA
jgi:apolipoprotein N-acyltransferase